VHLHKHSFSVTSLNMTFEEGDDQILFSQ